MQTRQGFRLNEIVANYRQRVELPSYVLAVDWFDRAFRSLSAIHASGRLHRSIGLDKVLIAGDDEVSIDEGPANSDGGSLVQAGSINCPAPEQIAGRAVDRRSDIYSLGAVFYELLTLRQPGGYPDPASSVNVTVPKGFDAILSRTLAADPDERYASADEVLAELDAFRRSPASRVLPGGMFPPNQPVRPVGVPRAAMIAAGAIIGAIGGAISGAVLHSLIPATVLVGAIVGGVVGSLAKNTT